MDLRRRLMANNVGSALSTLLTSGLTFYAPFADSGSGAVSLIASGAGASQTATFTRATTATTVNSAGLIVSVASGVARSYYDPTTLEYRGYLAEGARENLHPASADMTNASYWAATRASWPGTTTTAPDGTATGQKLVEDSTASNTHVGLSFADVTVVTATTYTSSVWAKAGERTWFALQEGQGVTATAYFNLSAGTVGTVSGTGSPSATIKAYPNGWYRCTLTFTSSGTAARIRLFLANGDGGATYDGDGTSGAYFWGAGMEAGSFPSSYIPTTTAAVTRNADVLTYAFSGNASASVGTAYAELSGQWATAPGVLVAIAFSNTTYPLYSSSGATTAIQATDNAAAATKSGLTSMLTGSRKRASSWGGSTMSVTGDGASPGTAAFAGNMGSARVDIGNVNGAAQWFGTLRNVRIYSTQFTAAQLQAITAG